MISIRLRFLLWTFDQIVETRRHQDFGSRNAQSPVAELVLRHVHRQLSQSAEAIGSGDPAEAEKVVRAYLAGLAVSSAV